MREKKRILFHITGFCGVFICIFFTIERFFFNKCDILYSWYRVQDIDEDIDFLILGNSHAFTSTNAVVLENALGGGNWEVFASSNQNMELTLVHLKTALKYKDPKYVLLEVYSPTLDNKENLTEGGQRGNLMMDLDGIHDYTDKFLALWSLVDWKSIPEGMFQLCRPANRWERWNLKRNRQIKESKTQGYEAATTANSFATGTKRVEDVENACRAVYLHNELENLADYNQQALVEFLEITQKNEINVILYEAPTMRTGDVALVNEVFTIAKDYNNVICCQDTRCNMLSMGLDLEDFYDDGHLNKRGGEKFTYYFGNLLAEKLNLSAKWDNVFAYRGEKIESLSDGQFMYSMENYCNDTLYQFELYKDDELIEKTDFSEENYYLCDIDISKSEGYRLYCSMIPMECVDIQEKCQECIFTEFMNKNKCIIE